MTKNVREPSGNSEALFGRLRSYHYTTPAQRIQVVFHSHVSVKGNSLIGNYLDPDHGAF